MKCPSCNKDVSAFSKAMNRFERKRSCPHCGAGVKLRVDPKRAALLFVPAVILSLLLRPLLGEFSTPAMIVLLLLLTFKLEPAV